MKSDYPQPNHSTFSTDCGGGTGGSSSVNNRGVYSNGKSKTWEETEQDTGVDELLAILGYKFRSSDMADVAQKLEHLEEVMGQAQQDGLSYLTCDTVHYKPSDLSSWLESMISELDPPPPGTDPFLAHVDDLRWVKLWQQRSITRVLVL